MAALVAAIHVLTVEAEDVDARHKAGHDDVERLRRGLFLLGVMAGLVPAIHVSLR